MDKLHSLSSPTSAHITPDVPVGPTETSGVMCAEVVQCRVSVWGMVDSRGGVIVSVAVVSKQEK